MNPPAPSASGPCRTRGAVLRLALLAAAATPACDSYEAPCKASPATLVLDEPQLPNSISTLSSLTTQDDAFVATWLTLALGEHEEARTYKPRLAQVAVLRSDGVLTERNIHPLFPGFDEDEVPEDNVGFCWTPHGIVVHWTRDTTLSDVGEPPSIRTELRLRHIGPDGAASPPFAPVGMSCADCVVRVSSACNQRDATLLLSIFPINGERSEPIRALAWDLVEDRITSGPVDWIDTPSQWPGPWLQYRDGVLLLFTSDEAWAVDAKLSLRGGPIPLPASPNRMVHWSGDAFEGTVVWSTAALAPATHEASDDVFMRRYDGFGRPLMSVERLGASARVAAMTRKGDELGLILRDRGMDAFAWADAQGARVGGDIRLGPAFQVSGKTAGVGEALLSIGPGRYVHLIGEPGRLQHREIICAP